MWSRSPPKRSPLEPLVRAARGPGAGESSTYGSRLPAIDAMGIDLMGIDLLGIDTLTNAVRGWRTGTYGRMSVEQIQAQYDAPEVTIEHPVLLIRINQLFRYGMSDVEVYDATRGIWRLGRRREEAKYAFAVFDGVVQEVYRIRGWYPAGSTLSSRRDLESEDRWEFVGSIAKAKVRDRYRYGSVRSYLTKGSQNPVQNVNCRFWGSAPSRLADEEHRPFELSLP